MKIKKKLLIIGGAGYIGSVLSPSLVKAGYQVTVLDNLIYNQKKLQISNKNFKFILGDLRNKKIINNLVKSNDIIILLAGLVGDPITKKYPLVSSKINNIGIKHIIKVVKKNKIENFIFVSTCSNYGIVKNNILAKENHNLYPLSRYAKDKVKVENFIKKNIFRSKTTTTILRFATAFGLAPRMRFDLTVNEFTKILHEKKNLEIYDTETWRPYCHVKDFSLLIEKVLDSNNDKTHFEIFNAGSDINHATKKNIIDMINNYVPNTRVVYSKNGNDPRNYRVNFGKAREILSFNPNFSIKDGISELIKSINDKKFIDVDTNRNNYGNYVIDYKY